jgi:UDPglucose 6-dehydrogenase
MIGTGYVGLVTGACLADFGHRVTCADVDARKIERLRHGEMPIYEPGLSDLVSRNREDRRLHFSDDLPGVVQENDVLFVAVGTPARRDGSADLSAVFDVGRLVARHHGGRPKVVVQKSTAPVGTARRLWEEIRRQARRAHIEVAANPEFLRQGSAIDTFMRPDRIVIGAETARAERLLRAIYRPLYLIETPMVVTGLETAEIIKYAANAFLATKISFINEIANLCEASGADVQMVAQGIGLDGRIGRKFLHAGPGYGGSCFPKDTAALVRFAREVGEPMHIVQAGLEVNRAQRIRMVEKIERAVGSLRRKRVALLGLSFKPNTDDTREAPALAIAEACLRRGAAVVAHDPVAMDAVARTPLGSRLEFALDPYAAARGADALVLVTEWNQYRRLDLARIARSMRRAILLDLRNVYEPADALDAGLEYHGVGRPVRWPGRVRAGTPSRRTARRKSRARKNAKPRAASRRRARRAG